jgi:hypothetical protein
MSQTLAPASVARYYQRLAELSTPIHVGPAVRPGRRGARMSHKCPFAGR